MLVTQHVTASDFVSVIKHVLFGQWEEEWTTIVFNKREGGGVELKILSVQVKPKLYIEPTSPYSGKKESYKENIYRLLAELEAPLPLLLLILYFCAPEYLIDIEIFYLHFSFFQLQVCLVLQMSFDSVTKIGPWFP